MFRCINVFVVNLDSYVFSELDKHFSDHSTPNECSIFFPEEHQPIGEMGANMGIQAKVLK